MTDKLIIDCHHHLGRDPDYAAKLVDECARLGIAHVCTIAPSEEEGNARLAALLPKYWDTIITRVTPHSTQGADPRQPGTGV